MSFTHSDNVNMDESFGAGETLSMAVITAVADVTGQSPLEMDPLWESIDADALEALLGDTGQQRPAPTVTFTYCDCEVTVTNDDIQIDRSD